VRGDPLSNLFGDVPARVVPDQHPNLLAERFELLGAPRKEASSYPAHRATIHKARPHLLKLGHIKPVAGDGLGIRIVFFDRLLHQATVLSVGALGAPALHRTPNEPKGVTMKVSDTSPTNGGGQFGSRSGPLRSSISPRVRERLEMVSRPPRWIGASDE
jgi:hypothetical protein